jgi:glycosyltransferase involved in cell wall biosynthesis
MSFANQKVIVVVPAYNEETQVAGVVRAVPEWVDAVVVVDDCSRDRTAAVAEELKPDFPRLVVIRHPVNQGVGGAIVTGYTYARDHAFDVAVVMAGDGQMDPDDLPAIVGPVARGEVDYCKGNRLFTGEAYRVIPKVRYFGNAVLSLLTKVASGYWHVADSQTGYTAINLRMLRLIDWSYAYKRYGCPNDYLVRLNIYNARVRDVPIRPVYGVGEKSKIRLHKVIPRISLLLLRLFLKRMFQKYVIRDFHPLVLFYAMSFLLLVPGLILGLDAVLHRVLVGPVAATSVLFVVFLLVSGIQFGLFAMFMDMEVNKDLR